MNPALVEFLKHPGQLPARPDAAAAAPAKTAVPRPATAPLTVLVLEGEYRLTGAVLFCLSRQPGVRAHLLSRDARSPYQFSHYVRSFHLLGPESPAEVFVAFVQNAAHATGAEVLLPVDVAGMRFVIEHRAALAAAVPLLPLPAAAYYEIATDKGLLGVFMQEYNIPAPDTIVDIWHNLAAKLAQFEFPVLLKPIEGAGGRGIVRYATPEALLAAVAALPDGSRYIVQNCIEGYDIDCNVLYQNGQLVAHSIQKGLVATGDEYAPTEAIEFVHHDAVLAVVDRLMKALRWNGVAHLDLRYDARARQIKVIEINTRFWLTVVGSALAAGVNFPLLACQVAAGRAVAPAPFREGRYIPFANYLKYRYGRRVRRADDVQFALRDTSVGAFLGDPLTKLYRFLTDED
ncbi:ATP-grasp domain-containing protein [Hymenobacter siberiensis]|uniref:ATP-grasp domain-containing protein n=1 Tax=Hymenobacter siberiensis TaxID=2848396 RepID=UPI001C1E30B4|nr:ATP-grasp domain-containing protein [Hymenobacter siberiensis]MBU6120449.1 ATP-grasp domain-containing protein [Hymenobacter siberiensis]